MTESKLADVFAVDTEPVLLTLLVPAKCQVPIQGRVQESECLALDTNHLPFVGGVSVVLAIYLDQELRERLLNPARNKFVHGPKPDICLTKKTNIRG